MASAVDIANSALNLLGASQFQHSQMIVRMQD